MPSTLRIELTRAGFTIGGPSTTLVVQDYADPSKSSGHAKPNATHTVTSSDPILDRKFSSGHQWTGMRRIVAYDPNYVYVLTNIPSAGVKFTRIPLTAAQVTGSEPVPYISIEKSVHKKAV